MTPDSGADLETLRLMACLDMFEKPELDIGIRTSCRAVLEGPTRM